MMVRAVVERVASSARLEAVIRLPDETQTLWFEPIGFDLHPPTLDWALVALAPFAMRSGSDIYVDGPVRASQLARIEEFQDAWTIWRRDLFDKVTFDAAEIVPDEVTPGDDVVAAFSGGIDSSYLIAANVDRLLGHRSRRIVSAVMVHGFDIALEDCEAFRRAMKRSQAALTPLGIDVVGVRTNWREISRDWTMTFGVGVASALHPFSGMVSGALWAADSPYHQASPVWGTNPVTNHLLGNASFPIESVGFGVTRTDKAAYLRRFPSLLEHVRVCWEGDRPGENCGACEKCVRSKLNFLAAGAGIVPGLGELTLGQLRSLRVKNDRQLNLLREVPTKDLPPKLARTLRSVIAREGLRLGIGTLRGSVKGALKRFTSGGGK